MVWRSKIRKNSHNSEIDIEQFFLDKIFKEREIIIADKKIEVPLKNRSFFLLALFGFLVVSVLIFFAFDLQFSHKKEYIARAEQNKYISFRIHAERGIIYDKNNYCP